MRRKTKQIAPIDAGIADAYAPECWEQKRPLPHQSENNTDAPVVAAPAPGLVVASRRVWGYLTAPY